MEGKTAGRSAFSQLRAYGIALLCVLAAFLTTLALQHFFPYPFLFLFFAAVMASAWFGGAGAGLFAVLISTILVDYFFLPPFHSFAVSGTAEAYFAAFVLCALVASWLSAAQKKSEQALKDARDQLEVRVSERSSELMKTQSELAYLSRVLSMGELAASISHEIGQPLTAVLTHGHACVEWLSANPPNVVKARHSAERVVEDSTRAGNVLSRIRALFSRQGPSKEWIDINEMIQDLLNLVAGEARRRKIVIRTNLGVDLPKTHADRVQLQQVALNLVMNAMDAMGETPTPLKELTITSKMEGERELSVSIADRGPGFTSENRERIFEPFFTTKPHGTGMGLAISRSIIESHNGRIWATSTPEVGTTFQFAIPVLDQEDD